MLKSFLAVIISVLIIFSNTILAQESNFIQINGGIIMPMSSSKGLTASVQFSHPINNNIQFYFYTGYSSWDKFRVNFNVDWSLLQQQTHFSSYSSDNHVLIPVYLGGRINFNINKIFTAFAVFEIGYAHLSYNSYEITKEVNPANGVVLGYYPDKSTKTETNENLIGAGAGIGISHPINKNVNLIFLFKLNSQINSKYYRFLSAGGTSTAYLAGFNFAI